MKSTRTSGSTKFPTGRRVVVVLFFLFWVDLLRLFNHGARPFVLPVILLSLCFSSSSVFSFYGIMSRNRFLLPTLLLLGVPVRNGDSFRFPPPPPPPPLLPPSSGIHPMFSLSVLVVLAASILLLAYYFIGGRCCFCRRRADALGRSRRHLRDNLVMLAVGARGLAASEIRRIPTFQYSKESGAGGGAGDCAVCLGEFQEEETIRLLPDCFHVFHVNCIDTWLRSNANCPLCRAIITPAGAAAPVPVDRLPAFVRSRGFDQRNRSDDVVIDVKDDEREVERRRQLRRHGSVDARRLLPASRPMCRSFSVGSAVATDRRLYGEVQKIEQHNPHFQERVAATAGGAGEGSSGASRVRWRLFSFHGRSSGLQLVD